MEKGQSPERITKRIQQREAEKEALEKQLAKEKRKQPTLQLEHILAFLNYPRDLPGTDKVKRKTLITIFVNSVYLYDDYFTIIFNGGNATLRAENIPLESIENNLKQALNKTYSGSGAVISIPPDATQTNPNIEGSSVSACKQKTGTIVGPVYFNGGFAMLVWR